MWREMKDKPMKRALFLLTALLTLPVRAGVKPFVFAQITDTHISTQVKYHQNLANAIAELNAMNPRPGFVIHTGDITEMGAASEFAKYREIIGAAAMPVKNTPGNHETRWADKSINRFTEYLGSPNISFKYNGVRFIGFNAAIWLEHHGVVSGDTRRWIVSQLRQDPKGTPAIIFCHQSPMYPDNAYITGDVELFEAIKPYNVRLFLNGHGHISKLWTVDGVLCRMAKGMMNDDGGYGVYEVDEKEIRVYDKTVGGERRLVATIPTQKPRPAEIELTDAAAETAMRAPAWVIRVKPGATPLDRVEYLVDHHQRPDDRYWTRLAPGAGGRYYLTLADFAPGGKGTPGRHTLAIRAVESTGGAWMKVVEFRKPGPEDARVFTAGTALQGPAAVDNDAVYVGGWDGRLYAVERATLKQRWAFATKGAVIGRPDVDGKAVYFGSTDENVYALDRRSGRLLWRFKTGGPIQGHTTVSGGVVYVPSGDHKLYAIEAATGKQKWAYEMKMHAQARPAVVDGTVFIGAWDGVFYALNAQTGEPRWTYRVADSIFFSPAVSSPLVVDGKVIISQAVPPRDAEGPHVLCLNAATGEKVWGYRMASGSAAYASATSDGKRVFTATLSGDLVALNLADGTEAWKSKMPEIAYDCSPTYVRGQVVCNMLTGGLGGYDAGTGKELWVYKTGQGLNFAWPTVAGATVYQPSMDGTLTAVTLK
jgi:outer membrane protein assembly factor BamB